MAGVVGRGDRVDADAATAFHRWRSAARRAAAQLPDALLEKGWVLFEPFALSGLPAKVSHSLTWAAFVLPIAILGYGFLCRHGATLGAVFTRWGVYALVAMYGMLGVDALVHGIVWVFSVGLPRRAVRRQAALAKLDVHAIGLALSPELLAELSDAEARERALCWRMLEAEASQEERLGEPAARMLRRGVAPDPVELEMIVAGRRSATMALYCLGLIYLWWPLFRIGVPGWMRLAAPKFPLWPAAAVGLFAAAWVFYAASGTLLRYWLGCEPNRACRSRQQLASLSRARYLRRAALELLTDPSESALSQAERILLLAAPEPPPAGVLGKLKGWLFAEE